MKVATAKELKNRTGDVLRHVARGEKVLVTRRGKPVAMLSPATDAVTRAAAELRPPAEAWAAIEAQLRKTAPRFSTWQEAVRWSRRRA